MLLALALVVLVILWFPLGIAILIQQRKVVTVMTANTDALNALATDVHSESSAVDSAIILINGLANRLTDILVQNSSPEDLTAQIQSLRDEVSARAVALGQAVASGTAAENDSSNFPTSSTTQTSSDTSGTSTETTSSDTSSQSSGDTGTGDSSADQPSDGATVSSPSGDGTADVAPPSAGDNLDTGPDSPPAVETPGDTAVVPDTGSAVPDESTSTDDGA